MANDEGRILGEHAAAAAAARARRQARALRDNLRRRKAQARAREDAAPAETAPGDEDPAR